MKDCFVNFLTQIFVMTDSKSAIEQLIKQIAELRSQQLEQLVSRPLETRQDSISMMKWKESIKILIDKLGDSRRDISSKERNIALFCLDYLKYRMPSLSADINEIKAEMVSTSRPLAKIHRDMLKCCLLILICQWSVYVEDIVPENAEELFSMITDDNKVLNPYRDWLYNDMGIVSHSVKGKKIELCGQLSVEDFTVKAKERFSPLLKNLEPSDIFIYQG